jgi:hypothetical protein
MLVQRQSEDGLSRKAWEFSLHGNYLVLKRYAEETRQTRRHGWRGPFWASSDERSYNSKLPRPQSIPEDVYLDALKGYEIQVSVGWCRQESVVATFKL